MDRNVSDIMTTDVAALGRNDTLKQAAQLMKSRDIGFLPILENNNVVGVVTDRDLVIRGYAQGLKPDSYLNDVMTTCCITADKDISIDEAAHIMAQHKIRRICILDGGRLAGVCAIGDLSVCNTSKEEAGEALSEISQPSHYVSN